MKNNRCFLMLIAFIGWAAIMLWSAYAVLSARLAGGM